LIGWEEFRKSKWLISYTVVISVSIIDWVLSISMACDEVGLMLLFAISHRALNNQTVFGKENQA